MKIQIQAVLLLLLSIEALSLLVVQSQTLDNLDIGNLYVEAAGTRIDPLQSLSSWFGHWSSKSLTDANIWSGDDISGQMGSQSHSNSQDSNSKGSQMSLPDRPPLVNFENNVPPRRQQDDQIYEEVTVKLFTRSFANSYGKAENYTYDPISLLPTQYHDPQRWTSISLTQYGTARGRQFDRLGSLYLNAVEIWRTDNPEPVNTTGGIVWTTIKDVSKYYQLFKDKGEVVFDYPNIVDDTYTAPLNITVSLTVQQLKQDQPEKNGCGEKNTMPLYKTTPHLWPISKDGRMFNVPEDTAVSSLTTPQNAVKALIEVYASGTAQDEFWYTGVNDDLLSKTINSTDALSPHGPYREVQITIDDQIAGIVAPYPVIFTGGINPLLWRPQASWGSYDQPTYLFDVTPFLGLISDGKPHKYGIRVISAEKNGTIPKGWFVSGNLQLHLSEQSTDITRGAKPQVQGPSGDFTLGGQVTEGDFRGTNGALTSTTSTSSPRELRITAEVTPADSSSSKTIVVSHSISYANSQTVKSSGSDTVSDVSTQGNSESHHGNELFMKTDYIYPLHITLESAKEYLNATVSLSYHSTTSFPESCNGQGYFGLPSQQSYRSDQDGKADTKITDGKLSGGIGSNNVTFAYQDSKKFTFERAVQTYNYTVTKDVVRGNLAPFAVPSH
ncbi:unnamed protein product [Sympodiomycopsis kandeliae]